MPAPNGASTSHPREPRPASGIAAALPAAPCPPGHPAPAMAVPSPTHSRSFHPPPPPLAASLSKAGAAARPCGVTSGRRRRDVKGDGASKLPACPARSRLPLGTPGAVVFPRGAGWGWPWRGCAVRRPGRGAVSRQRGRPVPGWHAHP